MASDIRKWWENTYPGQVTHVDKVVNLELLSQFQQHSIVKGTKMTKRGEILDIAKSLTEGDRNKAYGDPAIGMRVMNALQEAFRRDATPDALEPAHLAAMDMVFAKISRIATGSYREDNYIDGAAYMAIAGELAHKNNATPRYVKGE